ncbi:vacuolar protein sorting-associated protein 16 homolog isoform X1 [Gallus gallus]|uniref:Vacuolar protein sorting-associated protein 16 homolog n=1 Tax=Gallus gallus TaxID=9031 RepID=A0A3Q2U2L2_CHICK|nr:vacuolar protein sorting-associated protein 16 homolog isoform X1 [Gallus gallus]XP_046772448.1 vacuolar protein sorting-associated protein 16 homolog isoform X1 [Gallus gallus]
MDCYTANWNPLGEEAFYRKFELYTMEWGLKEDLRDCLVAAAPYGGPIALLKNNARKEKSPSTRPLLEIYSASGLLLASIPWKSGQLVQLGWTASEDLLCIQEDGTVLIYNLFCEFKRHFSMGNEVLQNHVLEAKVFHTEYGTGVAILTGAHRFSLTTNIDDLKLRRMPEVPGLQKPPSCWAVLTQDRVTIVLLAVGQDLYLLDNTSCSVVDKLCEFNSTIRSPPKQMVWCTRPRSRQRAVVVAWDRQLMVAGDSTECIRFVLDEDSYLVPEPDGVRILSRTSHEFLHEIPEASQEIFKIASMAPGALLLEAQKEYEKESQKADEYLREIKDQKLLPEAVSQCIEAAGYEHEPETQKSLLRAASFGKCFIDKFPPESFVRMCQDLRVLNSIRDYQIGIPLTFTQYKRLTVEVLLDRLVLRRLYPLAIRICEYLRLPEIQGVSRILAHWACYKVQQKDKSDEEVAYAINQKLGDTPGISYSEIAARAYDCGRTELAIKLLEYEPRSGEQVPLLLKMKRSKLALSKAIESGDTDLVYTVVLHLKNELNRGTFFMTLQNQPVALSLYRQFCKHQERETLKDLYNQDDNHQELGNFHVHSSYSEKRIEGRVGALQNAVDEYYKAKNEFAAKATEDQIKLLRLQRHLQEDFDKPYLDLSLHNTVSTLIQDGHHKKAEQLYRDFKIPDKRYWWLKISALATRGDWEEMEKFSKSKKSPIGYLPFVEIAVKHHNRYEAKKYAPRVTPEQRVKAFILVGDLEQAADAAIEHKNEAEMNLVLSKCSAATDSAVMEKLNRARAQLLKK